MLLDEVPQTLHVQFMPQFHRTASREPALPSFEVFLMRPASSAHCVPIRFPHQRLLPFPSEVMFRFSLTFLAIYGNPFDQANTPFGLCSASSRKETWFLVKLAAGYRIERVRMNQPQR